MTKRKMILLLGIIVILIGSGYLYTIYKQSSPFALMLYGNVDIRTVNLSFRVSGRLDKLHVDEGDIIKTGQLLASLDPQPQTNALMKAQANADAMQARYDLLLNGFRVEDIAQAKAKVAQAEATFNYSDSLLKRQKALWKQKTISDDMLENSQNQRDQNFAILQAAKDSLDKYLTGNRTEEIAEGKANLLQTQAELAQAQLNLADTQLFSPSDGIIMVRALEKGSMLNAGNAVYVLSLSHPVWIRAYISERNLAEAVPGRQVLISTDASPHKQYQGQIGFVSPTAEFTPKNVETPDLRTDLVYRLRIIVANPDDGLRQGMPVTITLTQ